MDKKSKILILVFVLLILGSIGATYYRIFIKKDYVISSEIDCDPTVENCYLWECDPAVDGEGVCTGDPDDDIWYYKILNRKAYNIPLCDPNDEECEALTCPEGEVGCEILNCEEGEEGCVTSAQYLEENPDALLEDEECEEGDEECLSEESECEEGDEECLVEEGDSEEACKEGDETCEAVQAVSEEVESEEATEEAPAVDENGGQSSYGATTLFPEE